MKRAFFLALLLAGCQTDQERIAKDDDQCQSYGVAKGSPAYVQCRMNLDHDRANLKASQQFGQSGGLVGAIGRTVNPDQ